MSETLLAISAKEVLHQATIFYRTSYSNSSSKSISMKSPLSIMSSHQIHDVLEFISFYLSTRRQCQTVGLLACKRFLFFLFETSIRENEVKKTKRNHGQTTQSLKPNSIRVGYLNPYFLPWDLLRASGTGTCNKRQSFELLLLKSTLVYPSP